MNEPIYKLLEELREEYRENKEIRNEVYQMEQKDDYNHFDIKCTTLAGIIADLTVALAESARNE